MIRMSRCHSVVWSLIVLQTRSSEHDFGGPLRRADLLLHDSIDYIFVETWLRAITTRSAMMSKGTHEALMENLSRGRSTIDVASQNQAQC
jgi:hypothetical protein